MKLKSFAISLLTTSLMFIQVANAADSSSSSSTSSSSNNKALAQIKLLQKNSMTSSSSGSQSSSTTQASPADKVAEEAFGQVLEGLYPLSPEQIKLLHQRQMVQELALSASGVTPPKPIATSQFVTLAPGVTPPVIRVARGFISSLLFLDSTGAPWPIVSYDLGDPSALNIQWDKKGNTLLIQATKQYTYANMAITLAGLNTPVMLTVVPGQKVVDYRIDMRVQGLGPNAITRPTGNGIPPAANTTLLDVLDGVGPTNSKELSVIGGPAKAWILGDKLFVRTALTVVSPGYLSSMSSADGTHAYEMQRAPVLLVSWHGKLMQLKVEGL